MGRTFSVDLTKIKSKNAVGFRLIRKRREKLKHMRRRCRHYCHQTLFVSSLFCEQSPEANSYCTPRCERSPRVVQPRKFTCRSRPSKLGKAKANSPTDLSHSSAAARGPKVPQLGNGRPTPCLKQCGLYTVHHTSRGL